VALSRLASNKPIAANCAIRTSSSTWWTRGRRSGRALSAASLAVVVKLGPWRGPTTVVTAVSPVPRGE
jgi:hypothetical protein